MDLHSRPPRSTHAKRLFLAAIVSVAVPGCVTGRDISLSKSPSSTSSATAAVTQAGRGSAPEPVAINDVDSSEVVLPLPSTLVQPAGYNDDFVSSSPAVFTQPPEEDSERSFGDFLHLDSPKEDAETRAESGANEAAAYGKSEREGDAAAAAEKDGDARSGEASLQPVLDSLSGSPVEYFVSTALARHPNVLAARQRVAAAANVIPQAKALPDPTFNNTFWPIHDNALQTAGGRVGHQMSVNQIVPLPKKLKLKAVIASREVQMAQTEVDAITREITESVRLAYYEVWFNTQAIAIVNETQDLVADLTDVAEARYRSGGSQQDVLRAQLESDRLDEKLITLRKQKQVAQADLATLLQQPVGLLPEASSELGISGTPEQIELLIAQAEQCNPKLRGLVWEIQRDRDKERLACLQNYPDFSVGLNLGMISKGDGAVSPVANGNDNLSISFGTTLPIWRKKIDAGVREAAHRRSSTTRRLEAERDELYGKIRRLIVQADALVEQRDIYEDRIIPRTENTLQLSIADYRGKRTDFFTLIETYRELLVFETQLARIDATLAGTIAQIDRTVGCP